LTLLTSSGYDDDTKLIFGDMTLCITELFRRTKINTEFRTQNTIQNILKPHSETNKYNRSNIYQIKCLDYPLKYIGQKSRTFKTRYKNIYKPLQIAR
jgi:hypothetical protein